MAMVSNEYYGALCVKLKFHKHLLHDNPVFAGVINDYRLEVERAEIQSSGSPDYWVSATKPPKCLPDIVEAYVGAMFIDSGHDYGQVQRFFDTHIAPYFKDMTLYDTYANDHPVVRLSSLLSVEMGCYEFFMDTMEFPRDPGQSKKYISMVMIHGEVMAHHIGDSARCKSLLAHCGVLDHVANIVLADAKPRAATKAINAVGDIPPFIYCKKYHCNCRADDGANGNETKVRDGNKIEGAVAHVNVQ
jgi:endoribonuclease Dicer